MSYNASIAPLCASPFLGPSLANTCPGSQYLLFMTLFDFYVRSQPRIGQLCERVRSECPVDREVYDFIIVGGGTAGSVVARRLAENQSWKVLLLEAGPDEPPGAAVPAMVASFLGSELDYGYRTTNETNACLSTNNSCSWPRGKNLGGTSVHHGMMYIRGHAEDYNNWAKLGNEGWSWDDVLPYFIRSENNADIGTVDRGFHGTGGPLNIERFSWQPPITKSILQAAVEKGYGFSHDLNGKQITGFTVAQMASKDGVRQSSSTAFLRPIRNWPNLTVALNATATKIIIEKGRAVGVEYTQNGKSKVARALREVVVSGGAVDSPRLLLLSGIGPQQHLETVGVPVVKNLPGVGENLHNHISYSLSYTIDNPNNINILNWATVAEYLTFQAGPLASTGMSQLTGIVATNYTTPNHPDLQFYFRGYSASCESSGAITKQNSENRSTIGIVPTNVHPVSKGNLRLASNDATEKPLIWGNYLGNDIDVKRLVKGIEIARSIIESSAMAALNPKLTNKPLEACSGHEFLSEDYWRCAVRQNTGAENHQAGSCKMGPASDEMAVVDSRLRVHGIKGLRVADTSIMPQVTSGNTAAPAMMIGERVAAFIKEDNYEQHPSWYHPSRFPHRFYSHKHFFH